MVRALYVALLASAVAACSFNSRKFDDRSCSTDQDCSRPDESCQQQICTQRGCARDSDCGTGFAYTCNNNACEVNTCTSSADCGNGFACSPDGYCQASFNVVSATAVTNTSIAVTFDAPPDPATGTELANYAISGLTLPGTPVISGNTVTFPTSPQAAQNYTLTVTGVTRASDQAPLIISTATFSGRASFNVASAQAATSRSVLVTFDSVPDPSAAANLANYSISGLTVTGSPIVLGNTVTLQTSPQAVTSYTLTVSNITRNGDAEPLTINTATFTGRTDFNVLSAQAMSGHSVAVTFDSPPNSADANVLANYSIPGLTLSGSPALSGSTVTLTTSTQSQTTYTVSVSNVRRGSDNQPLVVTSAQFTGIPSFNVAGAAPASNTSITVTFDAPPVDAEATTLGNYSVSGLTLSGTPTLAGNTVTITTSAQSVTSYTVTVTGVHRASDLEPLTMNTANFTGRAAFDVQSAAAVTAHSVSVTFDAAPNASQAMTLANYSIPGLTLSGAPSLSGNTVTITTSAQTATSYTVTVTGVTRNLDAEPLTVNQAAFTGRTTFNVSSAQATSSTSVVVTFDAAPASAGVASNYTITGLTVSGAVLAGNTVTLTTSAQSATTYTVNVSGIVRASDGEPLTNNSTSFMGRIPFNVMAAAAPKAATLTVTFDAPPNVAQATDLANYNVPGLTLGTTATLSGSTVTISTAAQLAVSYTVYVTGVTRASDGEPLLMNSATFTGRPAFDVVSAAATTSHTVQVTFDAPPNGSQATVAANYAINNGVSVTAAAYPGSGNVVTLTTSAQSAVSFQVTVSNVTRGSDGEALTIAVATFTGRSPFDVIGAVSLTSTTFQLTYDAPPNSSQAAMAANYSCPGLTISSVSYPGTGNVVTVTSSAQNGTTTYTCTVSVVTRASDGEPLSNTTASFKGRSPFDVAGAASIGNTTITVTFDAAPEPVSAVNLANYAITQGSLSLSGTPTLSGNTVTITTSSQTAGATYKITVSNVTRNSDGEALTTTTATFLGKSGFNVIGAASANATTMTVTYDALPNGTQATTLANYSVKDSMNNTLALSGTPTISGNTVTITTAAQASATYTVTVMNVTRQSDGVPLTVNTATFTHTTFNVSSAAALTSHSVSVTFDAAPNSGQATTLGNYSIPGLTLSGTPTLSGNTVTLTTSAQSGTTYTVTVSGVTRASDGTVLTTNTAMFGGIATFNVSSAAAAGSGFVKVTFSAAPTAAQATTLGNYSIPGLTLSGTPVLSGNTVTIATSVQSAISYTVTVSNVTRASDSEPLTTNTAMFTGTAQTAPTVTSVVVTTTNPNNGAIFYNTGTATVTITGTQFTGTNCTTSPFGVKLNDTDGVGTVINTRPTSCTVDSDTQITATFPAGIRSNYAGWDVLVTNTANTSAVVAADKLVVKAGLLISEVYTANSGGGTNNLHEFVEIYNPTGTSLDVTAVGGVGISIHMRDSSGVDTNVAFANPVGTKKTILSHGYFLLVSSESSADAFYTHRDTTYTAATVNASNGGLVGSGSVYVSLSAAAQSKVLDKFGWKSQALGGYEGSSAFGTDIGSAVSSQRKPGGAGGDGIDTDSSANDWTAPSGTITPMGTADGTLP